MVLDVDVDAVFENRVEGSRPTQNWRGDGDCVGLRCSMVLVRTPLRGSGE